MACRGGSFVSLLRQNKQLNGWELHYWESDRYKMFVSRLSSSSHKTGILDSRTQDYTLVGLPVYCRTAGTNTYCTYETEESERNPGKHGANTRNSAPELKFELGNRFLSSIIYLKQIHGKLGCNGTCICAIRFSLHWVPSEYSLALTTHVTSISLLRFDDQSAEMLLSKMIPNKVQCAVSSIFLCAEVKWKTLFSLWFHNRAIISTCSVMTTRKPVCPSRVLVGKVSLFQWTTVAMDKDKWRRQRQHFVSTQHWNQVWCWQLNPTTHLRRHHPNVNVRYKEK